MAATLGGMMRAPIMAVVFALELTHDVNALLPLLIASAVAYGFTVVTMPRSILTEKIARRGHHIYREYGIDPLERHIVAEVMTREVETIDGAVERRRRARRGTSARSSGTARSRSLRGATLHRHGRPRHARGGAGVVGLGTGRRPVRRRRPRWRCRTRTAAPSRRGSRRTGLERLPVVRDRRSRHLVGLVARSDLIKPSLAVGEEEHRPERFLAWPTGRSRSRAR